MKVDLDVRDRVEIKPEQLMGVRKMLEPISSFSDLQLLQLLDSIDLWEWEPCDLDLWIDILDRFDEILHRYVREFLEWEDTEERKDEEEKDEKDNSVLSVHEPASSSSSSSSSSSAPPTPACPSLPNTEPEQRRLVLAVLRFSAVMLANCARPHLYNSLDRLIWLLNADSRDVVIGALQVIDEYLKHSDARSSLFVRRNVRLRSRVLFLACGFPAPQKGFDLLSLCLEPSDPVQLRELASHLHFAFPSSAPPSSSATSTSTSVSKHANMTRLRLSDFQSSNKSVAQIVFELSARHHILPKYQFALAHHVRLARACTDVQARRHYAIIKMLAVKILMSFGWMRREIVQYFARNEPQLVERLLEVVQAGERVPLHIRALNVETLVALCQVCVNAVCLRSFDFC